jgi:glycosyltransferase involved in cell wall biosynthesis
VVLALSSVPEALNNVFGYELISKGWIWWRLWFDLLLGATLVASALVGYSKMGRNGLAGGYCLAFSGCGNRPILIPSPPLVGDAGRNRVIHVTPRLHLYNMQRNRGNTTAHILYLISSSSGLRLMEGQPQFLCNRGFEIVIVSSPGPELDRLSTIPGIHTAAVELRRTFSPAQDIIALWQVWKCMRRCRPILINVSTPKGGLIGSIAGYLARVPCRVYTLRGLRHQTLHGLKRWVMMAADWLSCRLATRVISVSQSVLTEALKAGIVAPPKACVIGQGSSNGVNLSQFVPTVERQQIAVKLREQFGIPSDARIIGFVGRLTVDKGVAELVDAFDRLRSQLPNLKLFVVGSIDNTDPLPILVLNRLATDSDIICTGYVDDASAYYHLFDVLAVPTHREGFANCILEAHAACKPVVACKTTGTVDAIFDMVTGLLVPVGDSDSLADALKKVLDNDDLATRLARGGYERACREFARAKVHHNLYREYRSLLEQKERKSRLARTARLVGPL